MIAREAFGLLADGSPVEKLILRNARGTEVAVLTYGAMLHAVTAADAAGRRADVILALPSLQAYRDPAYLRANPYFGAIVGRYANRIAHGAFELDGRRYALARNEFPHALHGGNRGFDQRIWAADADGDSALVLRRVSPDGEEGYPGRLAAAARYALDDDDRLLLELTATADAPTIVNLTCHAYWNLAGEGSGSVAGHELMVAASDYLPVDAAGIPTGERAPVDATAMDFRTARALGDGGYDCCLLLDTGATAAARLRDPASSRTLTVTTTEPGLQVYDGGGLDGTLVGKSGRPYGRGAGVALEAQRLPDAPNRPGFGAVVLRPGERYAATTVYALGAEG
jgi:aldose 1-epimerase